MQRRRLPVRPDLTQLKNQAKDLLRAIRAGDAEALEEFEKFHPKKFAPSEAKLADAQLVIARAHEVPSWPRLVTACTLVEAIWEDDIDTVRSLMKKDPKLLHEDALVRKSNWGKPMSYAANLGRDKIITMLHDMGATDHMFALDRAALQGKVETAKLLHKLAGAPMPPEDALGGAAYTQSASGTQFLLELGVPLTNREGHSPVAVVLASDSRKVEEKHKILELYVQYGLELPDTPTMALHRGRIDLLEGHLRRDRKMLSRRFSFDEIYPPEVGCRGPESVTFGTPLDGTTLLHICADLDELEIAKWLLAQGADVNAKALVDAEGFGGHTPLFCTVVSQPNFWMNFQNREKVAPFTQLFLDYGADPNTRASLKKKLNSGYGEDTMHEYMDVTPIGWGRQFGRAAMVRPKFSTSLFVSEPAIELIAKHGGRE